MRTLETERLVLRPLRADDLGPLREILGDPEVTAYLFGGGPLRQSEADDFIRRNFTGEAEPTGLGVLTEKSTGLVIGYAGLQPCPHLGGDDFEFGFVLKKSARGKKYAKEIGRRQIEFGFGEVGCRRLLALAHPDNASSRAALESLGLRVIRTIETGDRGTRVVYCLDRKVVDGEGVL